MRAPATSASSTASGPGYDVAVMRVLVVEDEMKVATLIRAGLEEREFSVELCADGKKANDLAASGRFDAVVLDVMLPGRDGLSILRNLRAAHHEVPVILLTARADATERVEGLNLGADDYLPKPFAMGELVARLRAVLRRRRGTDATVLTCADLTANLVTREVRRGTTTITLTPREFALLEALMRSPGRVITRVEICEQVWRHQFDADTNVVDVAIQRLRRKIDDPFPRRLIQTVRGAGYSIEAGT
jgi:DNA-binding response OmpR family regulator